MSQPALQRAALLIIDMQVGLFHGPEQPFDGPRILENINRLIAAAREAGAPIFAVRHTGPDGSPIAAGSPLWQLLPELAIDPGRDRLFNKSRPSSFQGTTLAAQLAALDCDTLVIAGMKTQYCVDTTCRAAAELGLKVVLAADAHTCMDTPALSAGCHHRPP